MSTFARETRALRIAMLRKRPFWIGTAAWLVFFAYPLLPGVLLKEAYDRLQRGGVSAAFLLFAVGLLLAEIAMSLIIATGHAIYASSFEAIEALVRGNVLHTQLASGGPGSRARTVSSGDIVTRLRDDPKDLLMLVDNWVDVFGSIGYATVALFFLARIDQLATLVMFVPLVLFGLFNRFAGNHFRRIRSAAREATSDATDFLNASFGSALTVKLSGASDQILQRVDVLNRRRSQRMVSDMTWHESMWRLNGSIGDICIGVAMVVAAKRIDSPGEVSLFVSYAMNLVWLPQKFGGALIGRRRFDVAVERLEPLLPVSSGSDPFATNRAMPILGGPPAPALTRPQRFPLQDLTVDGLTVRDRGLVEVSFAIQRGTLTVISGPVGSGKTSLLRALIGLLEIDDGEIRWNGELISDRAAFFVPPQCAYVAQIPHLFSDTLRENLLLGAEIDPVEAIRLAAFDDDVAALGAGLETPIGAGGVRLSGGQAQRAAAARALVHETELLVFDDLTSALDVETELLLWDRLAASHRTVLAVSNRPVAIARADQHIELG
jgi:ATP-binding cassette, subfamily B, bacterial